ncbi:MAG TPA: PAS domain S-box protein, partial [Spirochaetota bacterium]|nr:PAS domain S-box protein [Spirochaetota bacterium]
PVFDFISPGDVPRTEARFKTYLDLGKRPPKEEFTYLAVDGSLLHIEVNSLPFTYGDKPATLAFLEDISLRKKAEKALIKSASHIEAIYRSTPNVIGLVSSGVICEANNQIFEMTEYAPEEIIGTAFRNIFPTESEYQRAHKLLIESNDSESREHFETSFRKKDGSIIPVLMKGTHFSQADNDCTYIFSALDITARKTAEKILAHNKEELKIIFENSPFIILLLDSNLKLRRVNKAALDFARLDEFSDSLRIEDIIRCGKHFRGLCNDNNPSCSMRRILNETLSHGTVFSREEISIDNGSVDHSSLLVSSCRTEVYGEKMILLCIEDITEKKKLNETIRQMQKLDTIGRLAGGVAHDFNNILSGLLLHISLLKGDHAFQEKFGNDIRMIEANIQRGMNLTRKLLIFGRREVMNFTAIEINSIISDLVRILSRILGGNIAIEFIPSGGELRIQGDAGMIELAIINLCVNARDAMPEGGKIIITADKRLTINPESHHGEPEPFVQISLEDNGAGLSNEAKSHLFDPFFSTKQTDIGTGLGLPVVYGIIKKHHGWINAKSREGKGTRFDIYIPEHNN